MKPQNYVGKMDSSMLRLAELGIQILRRASMLIRNYGFHPVSGAWEPCKSIFSRVVKLCLSRSVS